LEWTTLSEINNYGFFVERRSSSQPSFLQIPGSFIPGHGTTIEPYDYSFVDTTVTTPAVYYYRLRQHDLDGTVHYSWVVSIDLATLSVGETAPREFELMQNYPNPFNPTSRIRYALPRNSFVSLTVVNMLGQQVLRLVNEQQTVGYHDVVFNGDGLASGVYFYRMQAGTFTATKKLILLR
jgi:hypothetical protein